MNVKDGDINLQVNYSSKKAEEGIRKLTGALHNLRNTLKGIDLKSVVQSMNQVNDGSSKTAKSGEDISKGMKSAADSVKKVTNEIQKMNSVASKITMEDVMKHIKENLNMDYFKEQADRIREMQTLSTGTALMPVSNIDFADGKAFEVLDDSLGSIREISSEPIQQIADTAFEGASKVDLLKMKLAALQQEMDEAIAGGNEGKALSKALQIENIKEQIEKLENAANTAKEPVKQLGDVIESVSEPVSEANKSLEDFSKTADKVQKAVKSSEKALNKAVPTIKKHTGAMNKLALSIKRIIWYRMIRSLIREIGQAFKEGTDNVARYSKALNGLDSNNANGAMSELATISLYLKNSIGAAVIPILNAMIPALNALANAVVGVINVFNQLFNAIAGRGVFTKAKKYAVDYADSLDKAGGSAKNLKNNLLGIDELNIISPDDAGGGGGGKSDMDYSQMFEEATVDSKILDMIDNLKSKIGEAIDYLKTLWGLFKEGFALSTKNVDFDSITDKLKNIGKSLKNIFTDKEVVKSADKFMKRLSKSLGQITGGFVSVGYSIGLNILGGIEQFFESDSQRIKDWLSGMFEIKGETVERAGNLATAIADIFSAFGGANGQKVSGDIFTMLGESIMYASELATKFERDLLEIKTQPIIDNAESIKNTLDGLLGSISLATDGIKNAVTQMWDSLNGLYDQHLKPLFDDIADTVSNSLSTFLDAYNEYVKPFVDDAAQAIGDLFNKHLAPAFQKVSGFIGSLIDGFKAWWDFVSPIVDWVVQMVIEYVMPLLINAFENVMHSISFFIDLIGDIFTVLQGVVDFVVGVFTGDWQKAWDGIKEIVQGVMDAIVDILELAATAIITVFEGMWDGLIAVINLIIEGFETLVNCVIDAINGVVDALNALEFEVPDWIPEIGGKTFSLGLDNLDRLSLPRLANGGILPGTGQLFVAREAGPEMVGGWGNQTAVANNEQIVAGIQSGVASAVTQTLAPYLSQIATNTGVTANKDFSVKIGDRDIARANTRGQRSMGRQLIYSV